MEKNSRFPYLASRWPKGTKYPVEIGKKRRISHRFFLFFQCEINVDFQSGILKIKLLTDWRKA